MDTATARFLWRFSHPSADPRREREVLFDAGGEPRSATVYLPGRRGPVPAWILLHGITVPGRHHDAVRRMARALTAAGHLAFVPEVPAWRDLQLDLPEAHRTVEASVEALESVGVVDRSRLGLMAFSVAATWGLMAVAASVEGRFRTVAAVGGYGGMHPMLRGMVAGERSWREQVEWYRPDPYGRWILGANLLPLLDSGHWGTREERRVAASRLRTLALTAGRNGALAREPVYDALISALRAGITGAAVGAWDVLAPRSDARPAPRAAALQLADALADAALEVRPGLEPSGRLGGLRTPVTLLHGYHDSLIPYTETLRLAELLPPEVERRVTITRLIGHTRSRETQLPRSPVTLAWEAGELIETFGRIVGALDD